MMVATRVVRHRGVVCNARRALSLVRIKRLFQQRAEDRGIDLSPSCKSRPWRNSPIFPRDLRSAARIPEELAVNFFTWFSARAPMCPDPWLPELADIVSEGLRVLLALFENFLEDFSGNRPTSSANIVEQAAIRNIATVPVPDTPSFQREETCARALGNIARDFCRGLCRIERYRSSQIFRRRGADFVVRRSSR